MARTIALCLMSCLIDQLLHHWCPLNRDRTDKGGTILRDRKCSFVRMLHKMPPRILIFGTGAVGIGYACIFCRILPPENVVTVCRSNYAVASEHGFRMTSTVFGPDISCKPTVVRTVEEAIALAPSTPFDYVVITVKAIPSNPSMAQLIQPAVSEKTAIAILQNGIAIEDPYAQLFPKNPILSAVVYFASTQVSPAVIDHSEIELLHVGTFPADASSEHKEAARAFVQFVTDCGATAKLHDNVQARRWAKLMMNAPLNPICALSRSRDLQVLAASDAASQMFRDTMREIAAVARACGYDNLNEDLIESEMVRISNRRPPGVEPSMLADALASRNMEVDAIVGNVVGLAQEKNIAVPILRTLYVLIAALNDSFKRDNG